MKKSIRKIMALALSSLMIASMTACGVKLSTGGETESSAQTSAQVGESKTSENMDEKIVLKVVDWSDSTKERREAFNKKFMEENPNIRVEYTVLTADQFKETVISAIKAGNAPDLFPLPSGIKVSSAVKEGWYTPLSDYVSEEFLNGFGEGSLNEGITSIDGKVYCLPEAANIINTLVFYNKKVLADAGISEDKLPKTWSECKAVCKQVTDTKKAYGLIDSGAQTNRLELELRSLASTAGARCGDISQIMLVDGKNTMNSDAMVKAFDFYDSLAKEGVIHPDSITLKAPEARALFAQNQAAFIVQGAWCISTWRKDNPDLDFGVMPMPVPDEGAKGKLPYIGAQPWMGISKNCKHPEAAAKYLTGLYSEDYQSGLVEDGGFVSVIDKVNEKSMNDDVMKRYYELNSEVAALAPDAIVGNTKASEVYANVTGISPSLGEIVQGILAQNVDYKAELKTLSDNTQTEWEKAINSVDGVELKDFEFTNWDPMENYTADMYKQR